MLAVARGARDLQDAGLLAGVAPCQHNDDAPRLTVREQIPHGREALRSDRGAAEGTRTHRMAIFSVCEGTLRPQLPQSARVTVKARGGSECVNGGKGEGCTKVAASGAPHGNKHVHDSSWTNLS